MEVNEIIPKEREKLILLRRKLLELKKIEARESFEKFVTYTKPDYDMVWFHKAVCEQLEKLERGEIKKLMIFMPPQHGKSELSSRRFPAYVLGRNPKTKIGLASYSGDLSMTFNRDCQNIIDDDPFRELFPDTYLNSPGAVNAKGEIRNNNKFETVGHRGFFKSVGVRSALTGTPLDLGIVDDPFKDREEANSQTIRDKVWLWYQDVFLTRLHNDSKQLLLFTRWHEDDIAGRILNPNNPHYDAEEAAEWVVVALPALKEATKPIECAIDLDDPRAIDEALWEARHGKAKYVKRRRINPTGFTSLDQQRPTAEGGNKIKREWFVIKKLNELPFNPNKIAANFWIDGAYTEKVQNDPSAVMSTYFYKGYLYIFNCHAVRKELHEFLDYFRTYSKQYYVGNKSQVYIELKATGHPMKQLLRRVEYGGFNTRGVHDKIVSQGKYNRVENSEPFLASERVILVEGGWNKPFLEECCSFPNGLNDDMVDNLTAAVNTHFVRPKAAGVSYG